MSLAHAGFSIPGVHESPNFGEWDRQEQFFTVFGLSGAVHQPGGLTMRTISYPILIHGNYGTASALLSFLASLENRIGTIGTLNQSGTITREIKEVLYEGFAPQGGLIYSAQLKWFQQGVLNFRQLRP